PKVSYRWDPETDILTVACKGVPKGDGMDGTVDLEGGDGSFVVIDVAGGAMRGVDVQRRPGHVPRPALPARRFGRRGRHRAHRRQERQGIRLSHPRGTAASRHRGARGRPYAGRGGQAVPDRRALAARGPALPERRGHGVVDERLERYVSELFAAEDPVLRKIRARHGEQKLPP